MDEQQIQQIVSSVLRQLGEKTVQGKVQLIPANNNDVTPANSTGSTRETSREAPPVSDNGPGLEDLGTEKFKKWIGIEHPLNQSVIEDLARQTTARVCVGRVGPRPRTVPMLRFLADHARSKDTVTTEIPPEWLQKHDLLEVQSRISNKEQYLTRPDLGRRLSDEARKLLTEKCKKSPAVQVVISDGLSTDAVVHNYEELLPPLLNGLKSAGLETGTLVFLRYGRVKAQDEIGELLQAEVNVLLIGERPGLGQSDSLSCYAIYKPTSESIESDRTVISNIHQGGTPPVEAAAVIVDLVKAMMARKTSGIDLKR